MTVIVANRSVMLADTRILVGNVHYDDCKIAAVVLKRRKFLISTAGDGRDGDLYLAHFRRYGFRTPAEGYDEEFEALVLSVDGLYYVDSGGSAGVVRRGWFAIGSGGDVATGSIAEQLDGKAREPTVVELRRAMTRAMTFAQCGGGVNEIWLDDKKART